MLYASGNDNFPSRQYDKLLSSWAIDQLNNWNSLLRTMHACYAAGTFFFIFGIFFNFGLFLFYLRRVRAEGMLLLDSVSLSSDA